MIFLTGLLLLVLGFAITITGVMLDRDNVRGLGALGTLIGILLMAASIGVAFFRFAKDYLP